MNNKSQSIRVGLFFLLGLALAWITFESLNGGRLFKKPGYTLVAGFANLKGLKSGDEIRMAGVKVGAVQLTRLAGHRVEALLARVDGWTAFHDMTDLFSTDELDPLHPRFREAEQSLREAATYAGDGRKTSAPCRR